MLISQIGYTSIILLVEVLIADMTSLRSRLLFSYIPALPFLVRSRNPHLHKSQIHLDTFR